ncbi:MAG: c-type cytochrome [Anaerolineae bacterium]|jgi:mono/diheme cytochrome c family protein
MKVKAHSPHLAISTLALASTLIFALALTGCANPQPLPSAPTPIPTLPAATLPPAATPTERPEFLNITYPEEPPSAAAAQALYNENCAECHGEDGNGVVPDARNFGDADYMRGEAPARFYQIISDGRGSMPAWREQLSDQERWDLTFYVWNFAVSPDMLSSGRTIFEQNCVVCHGADGKGIVPESPDFTDVKWVAQHASTEFFQVVTEGKGAMPAWQGRLTPEERWAAIEYMRTFAYEPLAGPAVAVAQASPTPAPTEEPTEEATATPAQEEPTETPAAASATEVPALTIPPVYVEKGCIGCHGDKAQGQIGPGLVGLEAEHIKSSVRSGRPEAGMPAFDQNAISDDELDALAQALNFLTFEYTGIELSQSVVDHLNQAWDALQAGDKAEVETHLTKAQEAAADAPPGVQITLKDMIEDIEEDDWAEDIEMHLGVLLGK